MRPTRSMVDKFDFGGMGPASKSAEGFGDAVRGDADQIFGAITGLNWSGEAKEMAEHRASGEASDRKRIGKTLVKIADGVSAGWSTMSSLAGDLKSHARGLEDDNYFVSEQWKVTDGYNYSLAEAAADGDGAIQSQLAVLKAKRANEATNGTLSLGRIVDAFDHADRACSRELKSAMAALGARPTYPVTPRSNGYRLAEDPEFSGEGEADEFHHRYKFQPVSPMGPYGGVHEEPDGSRIEQFPGPTGGSPIGRIPLRPEGVPKSWEYRRAKNGKGWVWQEPGAVEKYGNDNSQSQRIQEPDDRYPYGARRYYNKLGQPLDLQGKPTGHGDTHIPNNPDGGPGGIPKGWPQ